MELTIDMKGFDKAVQKLIKKKDLRPVQRVVKKHGGELNNKTIANMKAAYTAGYSTGYTARSVNNELSNGGLTATISVGSEYFSYLEYGSRFMSARPTLHPAFAYQSIMFVNDLKKVLKD